MGDKKQFDVCVIGSCNVDLISYVDRTPKIGETIEGNKFEKGANQCVASAKLGGNVAMIGKVGNDVFGQEYVSNLKELGINTDHVYVTPDAATGVAPIIVDKEGRNSIIVILGANLLLSGEDLIKAENIIRQSNVVVCQCEIKQETVLKALEMARKFSVTSILNPAPMPTNFNRDLVKMCDIICPNQHEAEAICGVKVETIEEAYKACKLLLDAGSKIAIITMGEHGAVIASEDQPEPFHVEPPSNINVYDTTGAGDAFVGTLAVLMARCKTMSLKEKVRRACAVASVSVQRAGTQTSFPKYDELPFKLFE
ncbi:unnamed protein product [Didymodactylos carnosus]|uniref:Ribokinase n=1 Tax=Didymodactylos carnosus TaxID=1234261 RepID=A0A813RW79_9BILA|nr:unnamed protein product [Didymodactylos carnosus]CAF3570778.1 unnamed protein product [Didymodactylos carnosus]